MKNLVISFFLCLCMSSCCSLSLTNISTHGSATDVLDQEQSQEGQADLDATIPLV